MVGLHWLTADLLILIWITTITEITAPTWSWAKNRRWISVDLTCLEQPGMSWITMGWSAGVTTAPTGSVLHWQHRVTDMRSRAQLHCDRQNHMSCLNTHFAFIFGPSSLFSLKETFSDPHGLELDRLGSPIQWPGQSWFWLATRPWFKYWRASVQSRYSLSNSDTLLHWPMTKCDATMAIWVLIARGRRMLVGFCLSSEGNLGVSEAWVVPVKEKDFMKPNGKTTHSGGESNGPSRLQSFFKMSQ